MTQLLNVQTKSCTKVAHSKTSPRRRTICLLLVVSIVAFMLCSAPVAVKATPVTSSSPPLSIKHRQQQQEQTTIVPSSVAPPPPTVTSSPLPTATTTSGSQQQQPAMFKFPSSIIAEELERHPNAPSSSSQRGSGGVGSPADPLDTIKQLTEDEVNLAPGENLPTGTKKKKKLHGGAVGGIVAVACVFSLSIGFFAFHYIHKRMKAAKAMEDMQRRGSNAQSGTGGDDDGTGGGEMLDIVSASAAAGASSQATGTGFHRRQISRLSSANLSHIVRQQQLEEEEEMGEQQHSSPHRAVAVHRTNADGTTTTVAEHNRVLAWLSESEVPNHNSGAPPQSGTIAIPGSPTPMMLMSQGASTTSCSSSEKASATQVVAASRPLQEVSRDTQQEVVDSDSESNSAMQQE